MASRGPRMRFLTVTCNPAVDTTYLLGRLALGGINRVARVLSAPGGKGNNVARVLAALGHTPIATGFAGGHTGRLIEAGLRAAGVQPAFLPVDGESRVCLTLVERDSGRTTEVREPGPEVGATDAERLLAHVRTLALRADAAVVSGSLPPGVDAALAARLVKVLKTAGLFVALDAGGDALRLGLGAGPDLIKPNIPELTALVGDGSHDELIGRAQAELIGPVLGPDAAVLLSMGSVGAALIRGDRCWLAHAPAVEAVHAVGSGDALLAGFLDARARGAPDEEALARSVAVGTAAALREGVAAPDPRDADRLRPLIRTVGRPRVMVARAGDGSQAHPQRDDQPIGQGRRDRG